MKKILKKILIKKRQKLFSRKIHASSDISIISNCCLGGMMYHDVGARFLSPTIDLYFSHHCFIDYVLNIKEYSEKGVLIESPEKEKCNGAPIGILKSNGLPDVEIHFLHYSSFEIAKKKWFERAQRINFNNIYLVIEAMDEHEHSLVDEYVRLPYEKIIFTNLPTSGNEILHLSCYDKGRPCTSFCGFSGRRGYDEFDFVNKIFDRMV